MADPITFDDHDCDIAAKTLFGECRGEPVAGQVAVAWVIRNRATWDAAVNGAEVEHEWWGTTPASVCQKPWQFSCWNKDSANEGQYDRLIGLPTTDLKYQFLYAIAKGVFTGTYEDPTFGCTTYKVSGTSASWDDAVADADPVVIGHHSFWRLSPDGKLLDYLR